MADRKILIVDDENDIREVAAMSIEAVCGWSVVQARSGPEGIRLAETQHPDAILLDVMMPDMDGPTTLHNLRSNPAVSAIPVIFLTAKVQSSDRKRFAELGVDAVLAKPFDPMLLCSQIAEALGWTM
ncbi:MAG: response regulator [Terriglobia bacterium]|jgi:CheY-like chemotaxis protein|nr:response regulator [Terriglobia bacterium]